MTSFIANSLQYYGAGAAVIAAIIVAIEPGRRWMGVAMVIYVSSSIALIAWGFLQPQAKGIGWQSGAMLIINSYGIWRYLIAPERGMRR